MNELPQWMIYGANGFSGDLIAREAARQNLRPILAGRNREAIINLAQELNLEYRIFALDEPHQLAGIKLVLNCAGPFKFTAEILAESCISRGVHYLDISGELASFQKLFTLADIAQEKRVILLPGVGFFVVATDCIIEFLKEQLPEATSIELLLIIERQFRFNTGSIKSLLDILYEIDTNINIKGEQIKITPFSQNKKITINGQEFNGISLILPDLFTGWISTGISHVRIYGHFCEFSFLFNEIPWLIRDLNIFVKYFSKLKTYLYNIIDLFDWSEVNIYAKNSGVLIHGEASNQKGKVIKKTTKVGNPYLFTQKSAIICTRKLLEARNFNVHGFQTPSLIFGENLLMEISRDMSYTD